ncbi:MAG: oligopeptidase A [Gammaproteobacteria bacterium]
MHNPLLDHTGLPLFNEIKPEHAEPAIDKIIEGNRHQLAHILESYARFDWDNLIHPVEEMNERLSRTWGPVNHLNSVVNSTELRKAYNACLPKISEYTTELGQNEALFKAYQSISESENYDCLDVSQKKIISNALIDFRLSGIDLNNQDKKRYKEIVSELATLTAKFEENLLDAARAWSKHITVKDTLSGLPESVLAMAAQTAKASDLDGWLFNLEFPSYIAVMTYADDQQLRYEMYEAFVTRASDEGPHAGKWDNTPLMEKILELRHEEAGLLGFKNFAERSLATKMAPSTNHVLEFLNDLADRSLPVAKRELEELEAFARESAGVDKIEAWDVSYYAEKLRKHKFSISQEEIKPYFPETRVLSGMFMIIERLYGLHVQEVKNIETWHQDVRFYEITDTQGNIRGQFFLDLYARPNKRQGAWMDECIVRKKINDEIQTPVAYLTCNFSPPVGDDPALFNHNEVITLFHEFGHGLHHMLTQIDYTGVAGIKGVAWDAVELPSQFMENWCWEQEALELISGHYVTGESLPDEMFHKMLATKTYHSGMQLVRQLEFAIFDFRLHLEYKPGDGKQIYALLDEVRNQVAVIHPPSFNRFPHSFSHIFAGGYSAGYYSYKWAEVLSSDAFSLFEEKGIFDRETGEQFLNSILEQGGSRDPLELFIEFRGREPQIDALLRHNGITA